MKIAAYGFEKIGFEFPNDDEMKTQNVTIYFLPVDSKESLDSFDGVIVPTGTLEFFKKHSTWEGEFVDVYCNRDILLQREREITNLLNNGGWICCLVDRIIDRVSYGSKYKNCYDSDLIKFLLNLYDISRTLTRGLPSVKSTNDAFKRYIEKYGVAKTIIEMPYRSNSDNKILAKSGQSIVGLDILGNIFFLPFHTTNFSRSNCEELFRELTNALTDYIAKRIQDVPEWVNEFKFGKEPDLHSKINELFKEITSYQKELKQFKKFKGILTQSGDTLKDTVVDLLRTFFKLNVTDVEDFKEDAIIRDIDGEISIIVEIKGTKGGIKRKYINQLDSNRERVGLESAIPGLLIINDQMDVQSISERRETSVAEEQVTHSRNMNIIILRTIDLLFIAKLFENMPDINEKFIELFTSGGGQIQIEANKITML